MMKRMENILNVGPLNLDRQTKQACTALGAELILEANEFDALDMMAGRVGETLNLEQIYQAIWNEPDGADKRSEAQTALSNVMEQVNANGKGFMRIEYQPENGYTFRVKWGQDWWKEKEPPHKTPVRGRKRRNAAILIACSLMVAAGILAAPGLFKTDIEFQDEQAPLIENVTIPEGATHTEDEAICPSQTE